MSKKINLSKKQIISQIEELFKKTNLTSVEIKKIKKIAMSKNIKLKNYRKNFCKKCFNLFNLKNSTIKIKFPYKIITCKNCGYVSRYKLKSK
mgnify:CR=1 FL=1